MGLPAGANTWQELGVDAAWTSGEHLLASAVDALHGANWQRGEGKGQPPKPLPRPSDIKAQKDKKSKIAERAERFRNKNKKGRRGSGN
jgi:hypothetical protein